MSGLYFVKELDTARVDYNVALQLGESAIEAIINEGLRVGAEQLTRELPSGQFHVSITEVNVDDHDVRLMVASDPSSERPILMKIGTVKDSEGWIEMIKQDVA